MPNTISCRRRARQLFSTLVVLATLTPAAHAADIYGSLSGEAASSVRVKCRGAPDSDTSVSNGSFRITGLPSGASCDLTAMIGNTSSSSARLRTNTTAVRFDGTLKQIDGNLILLEN